jgi:hypothetical protein
LPRLSSRAKFLKEFANIPNSPHKFIPFYIGLFCYPYIHVALSIARPKKILGDLFDLWQFWKSTAPPIYQIQRSQRNNLTQRNSQKCLTYKMNSFSWVIQLGHFALNPLAANIWLTIGMRIFPEQNWILLMRQNLAKSSKSLADFRFWVN